MKTIIRIDRSSIEVNPNAGNTISYGHGPNELTGICEGELPKEYDGRLIVTSWQYDLNHQITECRFIATGDISDIIDTLSSDKRIKELTMTGHDFQYEHAPEPDYLYEYEDTPIECQQCKSMVVVEDIQKDYEGEQISEMCPICEGINTFDYEYERIEDVIKK